MFQALETEKIGHLVCYSGNSMRASPFASALAVIVLAAPGLVRATGAPPGVEKLGPRPGQGRLTRLAIAQLERRTGVRYRAKQTWGYSNLPGEVIGTARMQDFPQEPGHAVEHLRKLSDADLRALYGGKLRGGKTAAMYLSPVPQAKGRGVFAAQTILPGRFIGEFTGKREPNGTDPTYAVRDGTARGYLAINARHEGNLTRWINHSQRPNAELVWVTLGGTPHAAIVAIDKIEPHDQIFLKYGTALPELPRTLEATLRVAEPPAKAATPSRSFLDALGRALTR
jgi:hypothetical protein